MTRNLKILFSICLIVIFGLSSKAQEVTVNLSSNGDAHVSDLNPSTNYGSNSTFWVRYDGMANNEINRAFVSFDFTSLPANAIITEATLKIYTNNVIGGTNLDLFVERCDTIWDEGSVNWNNQPGGFISDQVSMSYLQSQQPGWHAFDVSDHVQEFVNAPWYNQGWLIRLQNESTPTDYGIEYNSSENSANPPVLEVKYILPVELSTSVTHCTNGNTDGTLLVNLTGGNTLTESNMRIHKVVRDQGQLGAASLSNVTSSVNLTYDAIAGTITADNIGPGIYRLRVYDDYYYSMSSDPRFRFYKYFLVGEEGATTSGILLPSVNYQENVRIVRDKTTSSNPSDLENQNQSYYTNLYVSSEYDDQLEYASFIQYFMDFDDQLEFTKADLTLMAANVFYNGPNSSNEVQFSLCTSPWNEKTVTWNTRPTVTSDQNLIMILPETVEGYDTLDYYDSLSILPFVEYWQQNPQSNYGFEMALTDYNYTSWASRNYKGSSSNQNFIEFEFKVKQDPVQITGATTHCSTGNDDGAIDVTLDQGSFTIDAYEWHQLDNGTVTLIEQGTNLNDIDVDQLENGLYCLTVLQNSNVVDYKYFLVGEIGVATSVKFHDNNTNGAFSINHNEDAVLRYNYDTQDGSTNYGGVNNISAYSSFSNKYYESTLLKYKVDFPQELNFTASSFYVESEGTGGHYRQDLSVSNAGFISRVASDWTEDEVTWDSKPTVVTQDRINISETTPDGFVDRNDSYDFLPFVQHWQQNPSENHGVEFSLQNYDQGNKTFSLQYRGCDVGGADQRPIFSLTFTVDYDPVVISGVTTHCSPGNDDASIDVTVDPGSFNLTSYRWVRLEQGSTVILETGSDLNDVDIENLQDGLYLFYVYENSDVVDYRYFFVGEEGQTTTVEFLFNHNLSRPIFNEDALLYYAKATQDGSSQGGTATGITCATNSTYDAAALIKYKVDFDPALTFTQADQWLDDKAGMYRFHTSENSAWLSRVSTPWEEMEVTWDTRPTVSTEDRVNIPTTTTIGYEKYDETFSILDFVQYWQQNPSENHGFELALQNYNQPAAASRDYKSSDYVGHNFIVTYSIPYSNMSAAIDVDHFNSNINVDIQGGQAPHTLLWSNGESGQNLENVNDGIYWLKIWDDNGEYKKYEVSKEQAFAYQNVSCTVYSNGVVSLDPLCADGSGNVYGFATSDQTQKILNNGNGWGEFQMAQIDEYNKAFGFVVDGAPFNKLSDVQYGFYFTSESDYQIIKNGVLTTEIYQYERNDIFKVEKDGDIISLRHNGAEMSHDVLDPTTTPDYLIGIYIQEGASIGKIQFGTATPNFPDEPCTFDHEGLPHDEFGALQFAFCENQPFQYSLPTGYYYRWLPEVGLSCYDCPNPEVTDAVIAGNTYSLQVYQSYADYLSGTMCFNIKSSFVLDENCEDDGCTASVTMIPEQPSYCPGDVIQFIIDLGGADGVTFGPEGNFNCSSCLDPQYIVPASSETLTFSFTSGESTQCDAITFDIAVDDACLQNEGCSFNNYGANVWIEKTASDEAYLNIYCNCLNEKVILNDGSGDVVVSGQFINESHIELRDNWTNNGETMAFNQTLVDVGGHGTEYEDGEVTLFGGYQQIKGVSSTGFYHLTLEGTNKKELFIDTYAGQTLNLGTRELSTRDNIMFVTNTNPLAITNGDYGFVSSNLEGGYLQWDMATGSLYFYPLGSSIGGIRYKPLEMQVYTDSYGRVRLVNYNPLYNGLDLNAPDVDAVNSEYFYYVVPELTDQVQSLGFHYHDVIDGDYQHIAQWDNVYAPTVGPDFLPWWGKTSSIILSAPSPAYLLNNQVVTTNNWTGFDGKEFVLAKAGFVIDWDSFGGSDDGDPGDDGVIVTVEPGGSGGSAGGTGGGVGGSYSSDGDPGTDPGASEDIFTPSPVEGIYVINVTSLCGIDGTIEFEVDNSGNIVNNSIYYVPPSGAHYPLAEDLYGINPGSGGGGSVLELFSIPEQNYICDNKVEIQLTDGLILDQGQIINVNILSGSGITVSGIEVKDSDDNIITPASTTATSWTAPPVLDEGIYKITLDLLDGVTPITVQGLFIIKDV